MVNSTIVALYALTSPAIGRIQKFRIQMNQGGCSLGIGNIILFFFCSPILFIGYRGIVFVAMDNSCLGVFVR